MQFNQGKHSRLISYLVLLVVILLFSVFMRSSAVITLSFTEDDYFTVTTAAGYSAEITWDSIASVEVRESLDLGAPVDGVNTRDEQSGTWENNEFGVYSLYTDPTVEHYIVLDTEDGIVVINFDSAESTDSLASAIQEML